jgi:23S rRNA pseudouridine1911/1915/1917 synthase
MEFKIIYEDKHIICIEKPQGIPSQSDKTNDEDLMTLATKYIGQKNRKSIFRINP